MIPPPPKTSLSDGSDGYFNLSRVRRKNLCVTLEGSKTPSDPSESSIPLRRRNPRFPKDTPPNVSPRLIR
jgi:hypothetical protein